GGMRSWPLNHFAIWRWSSPGGNLTTGGEQMPDERHRIGTESGPLAGLSAATPALHAVLRIGAGLLFMQHGAQKLFGVLGGFGAPGATAPLFSQMGLAGVLEFFGGL